MITLRLVTPQGDGFTEEVEKIILRGIEGDLMLMQGTAPLVTPLAYGAIRIFQDGAARTGAIHGGYVSMKSDVATVATDAFEWIEDIDVERARAAKDRAETYLRDNADETKAEIDKAKLALLRATNRLDVVDKR
ncbi:F-type H+-transporting ATPase subunit epsilon [Peptoniphilus ivorii]|uniref:ATP synthase F1 subunit epsilon n=1 Tax=Aedoeadaptatus ivorii TaxID=54006 RepID=UPI00278205CC|nr:ATP synthase F1 subunit epsilon [Peptoniphilus ivorii]MDQ0508564.1 F-type H+-transporting ATPase subunit epsilon [Peptoniphilus ivorii]